MDTNTLSYYVDPSASFRPAISTRMNESAGKLHMSVLSTYELTLYDRVRGIPGPGFAALLSAIDVLNVPHGAAIVFADLKLALARVHGAKVSSLARHNVDLVLAATAIVHGLTLVSNDSLYRDLAAIDPRLTVEDWTTP